MPFQAINYSWVILLIPFFVVLFFILYKNLCYGIYVGILLLPLEDLTAIFYDFSIIKFVFLFTFFIWTAQILSKKREPKLPSFVSYAFAIVVLCGLSLFWSNKVSSTLTSSFTFAQLIIWLVMTIELLDSESKIQTAGKLYILGSIIASVMALALTNSGSLEAIRDSNRAVSFQGQNPNGFSRSIGIAFMFLFYSINSGYFFRSKLINLIGVFLIGLVVILSQSRGTYFSILFALVPFFFGVDIKNKLKIIFILVIIIFLLFSFFQEIISEDVLPRILANDRMGGRTTIWIVAYQMILDHFWLGVGFGNFPDVFGYYSLPMRGWFSNTGAHNVYIAFLSELGIIGLSLYLIYQIKILGEITSFPKESHQKLFLYALFIYLIVGSMSNDIHLEKYFWFGFGIIVSITQLEKTVTHEFVKKIEMVHLSGEIG